VSSGTRFEAFVNNRSVWHGGAPRPTFHRSGVFTENAPVALQEFTSNAGTVRCRVIAFGDSITHHCRWQDAFGALAKIEIGDAGMASDDTSGMLRRLASDVIAPRPDYVILLAGTNDANVETAAKNIQTIVERLTQQKIGVILCALLPRTPPENAKRLNQLLKSFAEKQNILYHQWPTELDDGTGRFRAGCGGRVHPSAEGVKIMASSFLAGPCGKELLKKINSSGSNVER
ncbi:MAG: GDSL-type esterase/lipase family protein, partial [Victivallaceae bacterium]|nr:GDSL-type esterase/lipase family protein [Victivallaceae bacterium]